MIGCCPHCKFCEAKAQNTRNPTKWIGGQNLCARRHDLRNAQRGSLGYNLNHKNDYNSTAKANITAKNSAMDA